MILKFSKEIISGIKHVKVSTLSLNTYWNIQLTHIQTVFFILFKCEHQSQNTEQQTGLKEILKDGKSWELKMKITVGDQTKMWSHVKLRMPGVYFKGFAWL